jgi:hypothetical protein
MKIHILPLLCLGLLVISPCQAENDPVQEAIRKFENARNKKPPEVTVVLEPPTEAPDLPPATDPQPEITEDSQHSPSPPITPDTPPADTPALPATDTTPIQPTGVSVSVRKLESGGRPLDTSTLKILAPFPAKPLAQPPHGWLIVPSDNIPPYTRELELEPGKTITLSVKPHVLVPDADGFNSFIVPEPGYDPALEYQQNATIGAVLAGSLRQLDSDSKQLGSALDQLQQLLISLPKPKARPVSSEPESPAPEP